MRTLAATLALMLLAPTAPALAQRTQTAALGAEAVVIGLEAQYRAALIRERRLADDRRLQLIADAETRMREARRALGDATGDRAAMQAALDAARAEYARLVEAVPLLEAAARVEVEAFRGELLGTLPEAAPELVAAYQQFADGDRASAWMTLAPLLRARANARVAAARAVAAGEVRQLASLREIMRVNGEAAVAEVLALWDQAAAFDPNHFATHIHRARLAQEVNDLERASAATIAAQSATRNDYDRRVVAAESGQIALVRGNFLEAERHFQRALEITRRLAHDDSRYVREMAVDLEWVGNALFARDAAEAALIHYREALEVRRTLHAANPDNVELAADVSWALTNIGDVLLQRRDPSAALPYYRETLDLRRALAEADRSNHDRAREVAVSLERIGLALMQQRDFDQALVYHREGLEIARALHAADRSNAARTRDLGVSLEHMGDALAARGDIREALAHHSESLGIRRSLAAADPTNAAEARDLMLTLRKVGDARRAQGETETALIHYRESLEIARVLDAADRTNAERARHVWVTLWRIAQSGGSPWGDVVAAIDDARRRGLFNAALDGPALEEARAQMAQEAAR